MQTIAYIPVNPVIGVTPFISESACGERGYIPLVMLYNSFYRIWIAFGCGYNYRVR